MSNENEWIADDEFQDNDSEIWDPEINDELEGTVIKVAKGKFDKYYLIIEDGAGESWITKQVSQLDYKIGKMGIEEGDVVKLIYKGTNPEFNNSHEYKVFKHR